MQIRTASSYWLFALVAAMGTISASSGADQLRSAAPGALKAPSSRVVVPAAGDPASGARTPPGFAQKLPAPGAGPVATDSIQAPMLANCALGFNKTGETKNANNGVLYNFECTTPVITCPKNPVLPVGSLEVEIISTNPEQTAKRIRYECKYFHNEP